MRTTRLSLMPSMLPILICSGLAWRRQSRRSGPALIGMSWTSIVMWVPSVPFSTSSLVPWSVHLSGGRSMVWNGSIAWSRNLSVCGEDTSSVIPCSSGTWRKRSRDSKTYPSFLTVKEGSTFLTKPLFPQGREDVTALRCSEPLRFMVGGASKPRAMLCGMGPPGESWR